MPIPIQEIDCSALSPVEKMDLADVLYDVAQQELEALGEELSDDQLREIDRRVAAADRGELAAEPWGDVYERLRRDLLTRALAVLPPAAADAARAARWYERQVPGLGRVFLADVQQQLRRVAQFPESYPRAGPACRRSNLRGFPYTVVYRVLPAAIEVVAVFPCRAAPGELAHRAEDQTGG